MSQVIKIDAYQHSKNILSEKGYVVEYLKQYPSDRLHVDATFPALIAKKSNREVKIFFHYSNKTIHVFGTNPSKSKDFLTRGKNKLYQYLKDEF